MNGLYAATIVRVQLICSTSDGWFLAKGQFLVGNTRPIQLKFDLAGNMLLNFLDTLLGAKRPVDIKNDVVACRGLKCLLLIRKVVIGDVKYLNLDNIYRRSGAD